MRVSIDWSKFPSTWIAVGCHNYDNEIVARVLTGDGDVYGDIIIPLDIRDTGFSMSNGRGGQWNFLTSQERAHVVIDYEPGEHNTLWLIRRPATAPSADT